MNFDTKAGSRDHNSIDTAKRIENEPMLMERLQAFGLIEADGKGGWQLTECCDAGPALLESDTDAWPTTQAAVIRPWKPRSL